jgi:alpha-aminoadipic semialdehyde synthase
MPLDIFELGKTYIFFSHTIKGQKHNMPMLKRMMDLKCQLIDYEKIVNKLGFRLIFFGHHAGLAGIVETLWALGKRLEWDGISTPFSEIRHAYEYENLIAAKKAMKNVGDYIKSNGLPKKLNPLIVGITGYGNVSQGAQEILDILPVTTVLPDDIESIQKNSSENVVYKIVFKEEDMVEPKDMKNMFELQDYYKNPEKYKSKFEKYLPHISVLVNCIYWDKRYPRLVTKEYLKKAFGGKRRPVLRVIGDISCDIDGSIECTMKATESDNPVFIYNPLTDTITDGVKGIGIVDMAVDNLPCEFSKEASESFSDVLHAFIPSIAEADFSVDFEQCKLPPEMKNAIILYHGKFTPNYQYMSKYIE